MNSLKKIFVVEDDLTYGRMINYTLSSNPDLEITRFTKGIECLDKIHLNPQIVTLDYNLPDIKGLDVLKKIHSFNSDIKVIILSSQNDINVALDFLKEGAYDYLIKDEGCMNRLQTVVNNIFKNIEQSIKIEQLQQAVEHKYTFGNIMGASPAMQKVYHAIEKVAKTNMTVSIQGESGVGKELVAKAIHFNSPWSKGPFVAVNLASISKDLLESELFGHEKGSFTGALNRRIGKFEESDKGTLFLDEIAEVDLTLQVKLLRVIQEREFYRLGSNQPIKLNARIITATHKNLLEEVNNGNFREDFYFRLMGFPVFMPPLRDRGDDTLMLAKAFLNDFCKENKIRKLKYSKDAQKALLSYHFPGNVRELKAIVERAAVMAENNIIEANDFIFQQQNANLILNSETEMTMDEYKVMIVKSYMSKYKNDIDLVSEKLQIGRATIYRMLKKI